MERVLEDRQRANENEQAEKNRQMELRIAVANGKADSQYILLEKNMGDMAKHMAMMVAHLVPHSSGTLPSTTGTPTVTQISDVTMTDQSMPLTDMSGEKRKMADGTNYTSVLTSQVALTDGLSTQEEPTLGAAGD